MKIVRARRAAGRRRLRACSTSATGRAGRRSAQGRRARGEITPLRHLARLRRPRALVRRRRRDRAAQGRHRRRERDGRARCCRRCSSTCRVEVVRCYFEPGRDLPEPRAEPAARRRTASSSSRRRSRRAPTSASRSTATPTAASSSTTRGEFVPGRLRHRALRRGRSSAKEPGAKVIYDVRASWAVPGDDRARRRRRARQPRRSRVHQAAHARGGRRRSPARSRPLLLPRLLPGRHRRRPVPAHARADLAGRHEALRAARARSASATSSPARSTRRSPTSREAAGAGGALRRRGGRSPTSTGCRSSRRLALQRRPSNTEPLLRLNLEARSEELMEEKRDEVRRADPS